ncbi:MAG: DUF262 domain-containing HNH endonuclease family protein [Campylobacterota bacterium]|nr:DUF262 domain-containing HNH endonuclease family protein [Campylobacterota bacterium]
MSQSVQKTSFRKLFEGNIQFVIPFFQRGYAWKKEQWQQLFDDINDEIINELVEGDDYRDYEHFFSSIVVMQKNNNELGLQKFDIIDGQQRITTIYIILSVIQKLLLERSQEQNDIVYTDKLSRYLKNELSFGEEDDYKKLKVFSAKGDRLSTYKMLFSTDPQSPYVMIDNQFLNHKTQVDALHEWLLKARNYKLSDKTTEELILLSNIILDCLKVVWIPLEKDSNNAQAIFESLNARGTPLDASELLCNYIFRGLSSKAEYEIEDFHNKYWLFTKNKVENFDDYLMHLYSIGQSKNIGKGRKIYSFFKKSRHTISEEDSIAHLEEIKNMAKYYEIIKNPKNIEGVNQKVTILLANIQMTAMDSATPFLMEVMKEYIEEKISLEKIVSLLQELLTMLIRIKITERSTAKVGQLFPSLYSNLKNRENYIECMHEKFNEFDYYVSNEEFDNAFIERPLYAKSNTNFTRMILIELDKAEQKFGQFPDYNTLNTIEHICPQNGRDKTGWTEYLGEDANNEDLSRYIHTIGNLLLLSRPANSSASNNPFAEKVLSYPDLTFLDKDVRKIYNDGKVWNIESIRDRSYRLTTLALNIWSWKNI